MSSAPVSNPPALNESKSSRKKKAKAEAPKAASDLPAPSPSIDTTNGQPGVEQTINGVEGNYESPYIKELYKNIRNVKKKLNATQKVDSIIAENPDKTLDELLAARKINIDQKIQAQKKPALQASLTQLEEQIAQYKQFDEDYQKRIAAEKEALESYHREELEKVKDAAVTAAKAESRKEAKDNLLVLSKFLSAAAAKRLDGDETTEVNRAFEGVLLLVYGGDADAVAAMEKLMEGSDEKVPAVSKDILDISYKQVRDSSEQYAPSAYAAEEAWAEEVAQSEPAPPTAQETPIQEATSEEPSLPASDPTVVHAGLTEIDAELQLAMNGISNHVDTPTVPEASNIDAGAANAAAETNWEAKVPDSGASGPDSWVEVPRDPNETETGTVSTPAAVTNTQSWAEDVPNEPAVKPIPSAPAAASGNDGFHEVHHSRGRGRGNGGGGRGGYRGDRGGRGYFRGRGRGSSRGQRSRGEAS